MESQAVPRSKMAGFSRPKANMRPEGSKLGQTAEEASELDRLKAKTENMSSGTKPSSNNAEESSGEKKEVAEFDQDRVTITYEDRIKEFGLTPDVAMEIVDQIAMEGFYVENYRIAREVSIRFQTRPTRFNTFLTEKIDLFDPKKVGRMNQLMTEYQLAASLAKYGDTEFQPLTDGLTGEQWEGIMESRLSFIESLPTPLFIALCDKLVRFDLKLATVFSEGYDSYF